MIFAGTGHRPKKLGGYTATAHHRLLNFASIQMLHFKPSLLISGMALGWDQALAEAAINCRVPFAAYVPCLGQENPWPQKSRDHYNWLMGHAQTIFVVAKVYSDTVMQIRNQNMVDHADEILALFDGSPGGTANCVRYAEEKKKPVHNLWDEWTRYQ